MNRSPKRQTHYDMKAAAELMPRAARDVNIEQLSREIRIAQSLLSACKKANQREEKRAAK